MSYRCQTCRELVGQRKAKRRWIIYRANKQIEREIDVCPSCFEHLQKGCSLADCIRLSVPKAPPPRTVVVEQSVPEPPPPPPPKRGGMVGKITPKILGVPVKPKKTRKK